MGDKVKPSVFSVQWTQSPFKNIIQAEHMLIMHLSCRYIKRTNANVKVNGMEIPLEILKYLDRTKLVTNLYHQSFITAPYVRWQSELIPTNCILCASCNSV